MSDVAFLTMDLQAHGRADLAHRFLDAYLQHSGDYAGCAVLRFYEVYRALVRAMVGLLRARSAGARRRLEPRLPGLRRAPDAAGARARLLITHGLSGSGKSTVAAATVAIRAPSASVPTWSASGSSAWTPWSVDGRRWTSTRPTRRGAPSSGWPSAHARRCGRLSGDRRCRLSAPQRAASVPCAGSRTARALLDSSLPRGRTAVAPAGAARGAGGTDASEADLAVLERQLATHEPLGERGAR